MGDDLFALGEKKFAEVATYRGKTSLDLREWYIDKNGQIVRSRKGVKLNRKEWEDLKANWENFVKFVDEGFAGE